jgi:CSLREA domain-containing protein
MRTLCFRAISCFLLLLSVSFILTPDVHADTTFTVNTTADNVADDNSCTLREAISAANGTPANDDCGSGTGPYTINFSISGTITLGSELPHINSNMTIDSGAQSITVSGNNTVRVFYVNTGFTVTMNKLTLTYGWSSQGGGINNEGTLTVTNCIISNNIASVGGGISNSGTLNVSSCTINGNTGTAGGGGIINMNGSVNVNNSTISGNSASHGGGIYGNPYKPINVTNSTIVGNSATYAGGIFNQGAVSVNNTIIAGNPSDGNCRGAIIGYNNLADDGTCGSGFTNSSSINLGALGNYGGSTQTIPLLFGSAALDAGDDDTCEDSQVNNLDQRGVSRPMGMHCDIGAFEYRGQVKLLPDTIFDSIQEAYDSDSTGTITILAQAYNLPEQLLFDNNSTVTLKGGMDESYNPTSGYSPLNKLTVEKGQVVVSNIIIKH